MLKLDRSKLPETIDGLYADGLISNEVKQQIHEDTEKSRKYDNIIAGIKGLHGFDSVNKFSREFVYQKAIIDEIENRLKNIEL